jgi:type I restriction enzyme S subunit
MAELIKCQIKNLGRVVTGHTPPTGERSFYGNLYPLIKPTDMRVDERYIGDTDESLSDVGYRKFRPYLLPPTTTCVVTIGTIGKLCLTKEPSFCNQAVNAILVDEERHDPLYVYYLMKLTVPRVKALSSGTTSGRENVSKGVFESIEVSVHPLPEQRKIGALLSAYSGLIENNIRRIQILERTAQMLYREWFVNFRFPGHERVKMVKSHTGQIPEGWSTRPFKNIIRIPQLL